MIKSYCGFKGTKKNACVQIFRVNFLHNSKKCRIFADKIIIPMKKVSQYILIALATIAGACSSRVPVSNVPEEVLTYSGEYIPTEEILQARQEFREAGLGIFLHWGIYSVYGQGEWYMAERNVQREHYMRAADAFYPHGFDAEEWVKAFQASGAKYICFTTRHHDGFSMWGTHQSAYNIVDATPYGKDVLRELADACHRHGMGLHLYYSLVDWQRDDYPMGESCRHNGKDSVGGDYAHYHDFMRAQLTELLTEYGQVDAIWFDGVWDHEKDSVAFDWRLGELYDLIHRLQPACLVANNHHHLPLPGEDIQCFERDLPGENKGGYSAGQEVSQQLPLETCETMNWSWGYRVEDTGYKSVEQLRQLYEGARAKGANLLINIGPLPSGQLPTEAVERLRSGIRTEVK